MDPKARSLCLQQFLLRLSVGVDEFCALAEMIGNQKKRVFLDQDYGWNSSKLNMRMADVLGMEVAEFLGVVDGNLPRDPTLNTSREALARARSIRAEKTGLVEQLNEAAKSLEPSQGLVAFAMSLGDTDELTRKSGPREALRVAREELEAARERTRKRLLSTPSTLPPPPDTHSRAGRTEKSQKRR